MAASLPNKPGVQPTGAVHGRDADQNGPLELVRSREDDGGSIGQELEEVLGRCFDRGEGAAMFIFDLLELTCKHT